MPSPDHSPFVWLLSTPPYIRTEPKSTASEALTSELDSHSQLHRWPPSPKFTHTDQPEPTLPQTSPHPSRQHLSSYRPPCPTPLCCTTPSEELSATPTLGTLAQALTLTQAAMASSPPLSHTEASVRPSTPAAAKLQSQSVFQHAWFPLSTYMAVSVPFPLPAPTRLPAPSRHHSPLGLCPHAQTPSNRAHREAPLA